MGLTHGADFFNTDLEPKEVDIVDGVGFLVADRMTCDRNKLYLDTCATNHTMFATENLERIHNLGVRLRQHCNAGLQQLARWGTGEGLSFGLTRLE